MTPNQIEGVAAALADLLAEGHAGILEPSGHTAEVRKVFDGTGTVLVSTFWIEPEGASVVLSAFVDTAGEVRRDDARWPEDDWQPDPEGRPGFRLVDGRPMYSAAWL